MGDANLGFVLQVHGIENGLDSSKSVGPPSLKEGPIGLSGETADLQTPTSSGTSRSSNHRATAVAEYAVDDPARAAACKSIRGVVHRRTLSPRFKHPRLAVVSDNPTPPAVTQPRARNTQSTRFNGAAPQTLAAVNQTQSSCVFVINTSSSSP